MRRLISLLTLGARSGRVGCEPAGGRGRGLRRWLVAIVVIAVAGLIAAGAYAYFTASATAGSRGASEATSVTAGATPSASVTTTGRMVHVSWGATTLANGHAVDGYIITRYPSGGGVGTINLFSTCGGTVTGLSCDETSVLPGSWKYAVTPVVGTNWKGPESALSGIVTVGAETLTVNGSPFGNTAFTPTIATTTGSISGFAGSESVVYNLDSNSPPSGAALTGSPSSVGTNGNAAITSLGIPKAAGDGGHTVWALGNSSYFPSQASAAVVIDTVAPTASAQLSPAVNGGGWNNTSPVQVTLGESDPVPSAGNGTITYTTDGTDPATSGTAVTYSAPFGISTIGTTTVRFFGKDAAGNASAFGSQAVKLDTAAPTNSITQSSVSGSSVLSGSTLWYQGVNAGSFTLSNAVADTPSGPASSSYAALGGTTSGWTFTASSSTSGPSYTSNSFSWAAATSSSPTESVTGFDVAGNSTSAPAITFANDSTGPTGGSVAATGLVGAGSLYSTSTSLSIALNAGSDAGVGMAASGFKLFRDVATLSSTDGTSDASCGAYSGSPTLLATDPGATYSDSAAGGIATGYCYRYTYVVADKLGNQTTYTSSDVKVDTTAPSAPSSATLTPVTGLAFQFAAGSTLWYNPAQSGSFAVDSSTSDAQSGISQVAFPTPPGFTASPLSGVVTSPTSGTSFRASYSWNSNGASPSPGGQTITATDNATLTASTSSAFTLTKDAAAPTTTDNAPSAYSKTSVTVTLSPTDNVGGSGVAPTYYTTDGPTPTVVAGVPQGTTQTGTGISLTSDGVYTIKYFSVDNVGNAETVKTAANQVKIDKTNPNAPAVVPSGAMFTNGGGTIYVRNGVSLTDAATDPTVNGASSGVASVQYFYCAGSSCTPGTSIGSSSTGSSYSFTWSSQPADGTYRIASTVTDTAGSTATSTPITVAIDNTTPSTSDNSASIGNGWKKTNQTVTLTPTDPTAGGVASGVAATYYTSDGTTPTTGSSTGTAVALNGDGLYTVKYFSKDNVGNQETVQTAGTQIRIDETNPNAGAVATSGAFVNVSTYIKNGQALTDTTTSDPTVNGASSGVATVQYSYCATACAGTTPASSPGSWTSIGSSTTAGSYSVVWNSQPTDGTYALISGVTDNAGNTGYSALKTVVIDNTAPTTTATVAATPNGAGWNKADVSVTLNPSDSGGSGVASTAYSESGAQTLGNTAYSGAITVNTEGTTTITYHSVDNLSNTESNKTVTIKLDKTSPTVSIASITSGGTTTCEFVNGSQAWYSTASAGNSCASASGNFAILASASDPGATASGISDVLFPTFAGWTGGGDVIAPGPYSTSYGWTNATSTSPSGNATASDVAGNTNTAAFSITLDNTAPTGAITSPAAGNISATTTLASTSAADNGGGSGVKNLAYYRCTGTTSVCTTNPPGGSWTLIGTATSSPYNVSLDTTTLPNGSYTLKAVMTDNVGNQSTAAGVDVTINNAYTFVLSTIATQRAGTAFGGFTVQLQVNGNNSGSFGGSSYAGAHTITFGGAATANSPNNSTASGLSQSLTFNASGQATAGSITLVKAQAGTLSATDSANTITGSISVAVDSAGVALSYNVACPRTITKNTTFSTTIQVPNDSFGNAFTSAAGVAISLSLTNTGNWGFGNTVGAGTATVTITTGPASNAFSITESGGTKTTTLTATAPAPFSGLASCVINST